jgi:glycosyltransferase involved in cell wall biosynthesis
LGVGDRLHVVPYVEADLVPRYLESATVGVSSLLRSPNHDVAVTNKFCEYLAAGLPIVTSDTPAQATLVRDLGLGAVYTAGDPSSLAAALHDVLREAQSLHERIAGDAALRFRFSWAAQADVVRTVYDELLGGLPDQAWHEDVLHLTGSLGAR